MEGIEGGIEDGRRGSGWERTRRSGGDRQHGPAAARRPESELAEQKLNRAAVVDDGTHTNLKARKGDVNIYTAQITRIIIQNPILL